MESDYLHWELDYWLMQDQLSDLNRFFLRRFAVAQVLHTVYIKVSLESLSIVFENWINIRLATDNAYFAAMELAILRLEHQFNFIVEQSMRKSYKHYSVKNLIFIIRWYLLDKIFVLFSL